ncbi:MAG: hypothetical protein ACI97P_001839 [Arcticibacterium sp.]|jgi:hypothetical protein
MRISDYILKHRDAFAIAMVFCSGPLNYALRDGLGLAPNSTIFSTLMMFGGIFIVLPFRNLKELVVTKTPLIGLGVIFLFMVLMYMWIYPVDQYVPKGFFIYDHFVIFIVLYFFFYLATVRESQLRINFLKICIAISLIGSVGLLFYVMKNPNYVLGQRFAIAYGDSSEGEAMGNPHIFGRGAFFGIVASVIFLKYEPTTLNKYFTYVALAIFFAVLILSQAMSSIISAFLFALFYAWNNTTFKDIWNTTKIIFSRWYVWVAIIGFSLKGIDFMKRNEAIIELGYRVVERRATKLFSTFLPADDSEYDHFGTNKKEVDDSASGRVKQLELVKKVFLKNLDDGNYLKILFGNGYFALYVDIPVMEVFNSYGLIGFLLFGYFFYLMLKYCLKEFKRPSSIIGEFAAYGFVYFFVFTFTNGLIIDYNRWTFFALVCRFMPELSSNISFNKETALESKPSK